MLRPKFEKNIRYESDLRGKEPEFFIQIGFDSIHDVLLSIAHRQLSNEGSGLVWNSENKSWARVINGKTLSNAYEKNKKDTRIYHNKIEEHIEALGLDKLKEKDENLEFIIISNGNLGNNLWHVAWQYDKERRLYHLKDEPFTERVYSCLVTSRDKSKRLGIKRIKFNEAEEVFDEAGRTISRGVKWCAYGQQIVRTDNERNITEVVPIEEIVEQFYDVRHVFDLKDFDKRKEKDGMVISKLYEDYPTKFRENMLIKLREFPRAKYYHSTLGTNEEGIVIYHYKDKIEEIGKRLVDKGVKDAIILDQGGSVGIYSSWLNGFLTRSSYFRPARISTIAFVLK